MTLLATTDELAVRLDLDELTDAEDRRAERLLALASGLVQSEAGQTITRVVDDAVTLRGSRDGSILLPERPVETVKSVTLDGVELAPGIDYHLDDDELVRGRRYEARLLDTGPGWGHPGVELHVVYTHGYQTVPDAIRAVVLEAVVRVWVNPGAVMSERHGSEQVAYLTQGTPTGLLLTSDERRAVRRATRRGSRSVGVS